MCDGNWLQKLAEDDTYWCSDKIKTSDVPFVLVNEYIGLREYGRRGDIYGMMLAFRDMYEMILKVPVIMALISMNGNREIEDKYYDSLLNIVFEKPLAIGTWLNIANNIKKNAEELKITGKLKSVLEKINKLFGLRIGNYGNIINWRNNTIGHGLLRCQDSDEYKDEFSDLLQYLKNFFDGEEKYSLDGEFKSIYFCTTEEKVLNGQTSKDDNFEIAKLIIEGQEYDISPYVFSEKIANIFFESYYHNLRKVKYADYYSGKVSNRDEKTLNDILQRFLRRTYTNNEVRHTFVSAEEDAMMDCLAKTDNYIIPEFLVNEVKNAFNEITKGIIVIQMERGTGKTAFSYNVDGRYVREPILEDTEARTYHLVNAQLRGINDFVNSFNDIFLMQRNPMERFRLSDIDLEILSRTCTNPGEVMANQLARYHECLYISKDHLALVLDGIDELTEATSEILNMLPSRDSMADGTFIIALTRNPAEDTVRGNSVTYINSIINKADKVITVARDGEENDGLLSTYVKKCIPEISNEDMKNMINDSQHRFLFLKAYLPIKGKILWDNDMNERKLVENYVNYLLSVYGKSQALELKKLLVNIAIFQQLTLKEYTNYLDGYEVTYRLLGIINDIMPLLTVVHNNGENYYEFADYEYKAFVIEQFALLNQPDAMIYDIIKDFQKSFMINTEDYSPVLPGEDSNLSNEQLLNVRQKITFFVNALSNLWREIKNNEDLVKCFWSSNEVFTKKLKELYAYLEFDKWTQRAGFVVFQRLGKVFVEFIANPYGLDIQEYLRDEGLCRNLIKTPEYWEVHDKLVKKVAELDFNFNWLGFLLAPYLEGDNKKEFNDLLDIFIKTDQLKKMIECMENSIERFSILIERILEHDVPAEIKEYVTSRGYGLNTEYATENELPETDISGVITELNNLQASNLDNEKYEFELQNIYTKLEDLYENNKHVHTNGFWNTFFTYLIKESEFEYVDLFFKYLKGMYEWSISDKPDSFGMIDNLFREWINFIKKNKPSYMLHTLEKFVYIRKELEIKEWGILPEEIILQIPFALELLNIYVMQGEKEWAEKLVKKMDGDIISCIKSLQRGYGRNVNRLLLNIEGYQKEKTRLDIEKNEDIYVLLDETYKKNSDKLKNEIINYNPMLFDDEEAFESVKPYMNAVWLRGNYEALLNEIREIIMLIENKISTVEEEQDKSALEIFRDDMLARQAFFTYLETNDGKKTKEIVDTISDSGKKTWQKYPIKNVTMRVAIDVINGDLKPAEEYHHYVHKTYDTIANFLANQNNRTV